MRFGGLPCTRRLAGRCGHRPLRGESSNPGVNRDPVPGGHKARPYGETGGGSVGADLISARAAPPRRMHPRRPHAEKPPLGDQGEVARRSRDGGDQKRRSPAAYNPSVSLRLAGRCGHRPLRGEPSNPGVNRDPVPGGHKARPYGETGGGSVGAVRRTALHTAAGGPMWASAPTRGTIKPRRKSRPSPGRA